MFSAGQAIEIARTKMVDCLYKYRDDGSEAEMQAYTNGLFR
jgi:hypothetical protein